MTSEHSIQSAIMVAVSKHQCTVFRSNVGKVKTIDGRWFDTGLPKGHPDLYGFRWSDHLWGEAVALYKEGFSFRLTKEQQKLIEDNRKSFMYIDETEN